MKSLTLNTRIITFFMVAATMIIASCKKDKPKFADANYTNGITAVISNNASSLSLLGYALNATHYSDTLSRPGPFTMLCPSNTAFIAAGFASGVNVIQATPLMRNLIPYLLIRKEIKLNDLPLAFDQPLVATNGQIVYLTHWKNGRDTAITANGIRITGADRSAANGLVNIMDGMISPIVYKDVQEAVSGDPQLSFFNAAIIHSGMTSVLKANSPYTLFAPVNSAFAALGILSVDDVYKTDPATLQTLVKAHMAAGRNFVYDYILKAEETTNTYIQVMDSGLKASIKLVSSATPRRFAGITISGNGNVPAVLSKANVLAGNGVVHVINSILTQ